MVLGTSGCPDWEYRDDPNSGAILCQRQEYLLLGLRGGSFVGEREGTDSRAVHRALFTGLTPRGYPHYAGNYRGTDLPCLNTYRVGVGNDSRVGYPPENVARAMAMLSTDVLRALSALDRASQVPHTQLPEEMKLYNAVVVASRIFQEFLTVHPYANGNGHIARFIVWLVLGRYGYWPKHWTIEPQPDHPDYGRSLMEHRSGRPDLLESLILQAIVN